MATTHQQHPSLAALLEQSQRLTSSLAQPADLPQIQLGFDQIESQSRRIAGRSGGKDVFMGGSGATGAGAGGGATPGGVNADQLSSTLNNVNILGTFEPLLPLSDSDVEGYLKHTHEQTIISAIEEGRRQTTSDFYTRLDRQMRNDWESQKQKLYEELGRHQVGGGGGSGSVAQGGSGGEASGSTPKRRGATFATPIPAPSEKSSLQMHSRMMHYDRVVRRLNEYRKQGHAFGLVTAFGEASIGSNDDPKTAQSSQSTTESWKLLAHVTNERDVLDGEFQRTSVQERQYARAYLDVDQESVDARAVRKMVGEGARAYLEEQFVGYVEKMLAARPSEAGLGGNPSFSNKIRAFLNVKYQKQGNWTNPNLDIVNNTPVWARIYYCLRSGHAREALDFAIENEAGIHKLENGFVPYLKAWLTSEDRRLPKNLRDRFLAEYNQRIRYSTDTSDPYKHALYKLIGRVEINRRNVPGVTSTTEDWLWFQLSLVRETEGAGEAPHERYGLADLGRVLVKFGDGHFDPKGVRPILYFQVLLLCGQFERAIAFLHQHSQYQVDAVHFAIALEYYGLLRIPPRTKASDVDLLVIGTDGAAHEVAQLNFARLLHRYTRSFLQSDVEEAMHYLYLVCLNADLPGAQGKEQFDLCHTYIRELVMETRKYAELLGDVRGDGTKIPGMLERDLKLIKLKDESSYLSGIVKSAAARADQEKRYRDAILLYNLANEPDCVVAVLNVELGNALSRPSTLAALENSSYFQGEATVSMAAGQEDITQLARRILEYYDRSGAVSSRVSRKHRETCEVLLRLKEALVLYEQNQLEQALATIEAVNIIPLHSDLVAIIRAAEEFKELDDAVVRNFDTILLTTMNVIYKLHATLKESPFGDSSRQQKMMELRQKSRSLMMFAGTLRYRLTSDTYSALTRLDVYVS